MSAARAGPSVRISWHGSCDTIPGAQTPWRRVMPHRQGGPYAVAGSCKPDMETGEPFRFPASGILTSQQDSYILAITAPYLNLTACPGKAGKGQEMPSALGKGLLLPNCASTVDSQESGCDGLYISPIQWHCASSHVAGILLSSWRGTTRTIKSAPAMHWHCTFPPTQNFQKLSTLSFQMYLRRTDCSSMTYFSALGCYVESTSHYKY